MAASVLPAGSREPLLRRLLRTCEDAASSPDGAAWCCSPQAAHAVESASQDLVGLEASLPPATLQAYRARVEALQASLRPVPRPAYVRPPLARVTLAPPPPPPPAEEVEGGSRAAPALRRRFAAPGAAPGAAAQAALRAQGAVHDELTDELCEMASGLKRSAQAQAAGVRESLAVLAAVETSLEANVAGASRAADRAGELHRINRASCWQTCAVLTAVLLLTCWMVLLIRLNSNRLDPLLRKTG